MRRLLFHSPMLDLFFMRLLHSYRFFEVGPCRPKSCKRLLVLRLCLRHRSLLLRKIGQKCCFLVVAVWRNVAKRVCEEARRRNLFGDKAIGDGACRRHAKDLSWRKLFHGAAVTTGGVTACADSVGNYAGGAGGPRQHHGKAIGINFAMLGKFGRSNFGVPIDCGVRDSSGGQYRWLPFSRYALDCTNGKA